jgi:urease accessory protein
MIRATRVLPGAARPDLIAGTITLDHGARHRRRMVMTTDGGVSFLLDLGTAAVLQEGDALELEDGRLIRVRAAPEPLLEIRADTPLALKKLIWHIGNRHVPAEITDEAVYVAEDHVLLAMVQGLGAIATPVTRPFRPEGGAYAGAHGHVHGGEAGEGGTHG